MTRHYERRKKPNSGNIQNHQPPDHQQTNGRNMQSKPSQIKSKERRTTTCCFAVPPFGYRSYRRILPSLHLLAGLRCRPITSSLVSSIGYPTQAIRSSWHVRVEFTPERRVKCQAQPLTTLLFRLPPEVYQHVVSQHAPRPADRR